MFGPAQEIVIVGDPKLETTRKMIECIQRKFLPNKVLLLRPEGSEGERLIKLSPFVKEMTPINHQPTVYLCEKFACKTPITDVEELKMIFTKLVK